MIEKHGTSDKEGRWKGAKSGLERILDGSASMNEVAKETRGREESSFQLLDGKARGKRLLQLLRLLSVLNNQGVQEPTTTDLKLDIVLVLLDLDRLGIFPPRRQQKVFDLTDLFRHL
jgi:hypothetical protein